VRILACADSSITDFESRAVGYLMQGRRSGSSSALAPQRTPAPLTRKVGRGWKTVVCTSDLKRPKCPPGEQVQRSARLTAQTSAIAQSQAALRICQIPARLALMCLGDHLRQHKPPRRNGSPPRHKCGVVWPRACNRLSRSRFKTGPRVIAGMTKHEKDCFAACLQ
jgi:hypothetical protein